MNDWVDNASDEELQQYAERQGIENPAEFREPLKLLIQATIGLIIVVLIFYVGKIHDLTRNYIDKIGVLEETILKINKNPSHGKTDNKSTMNDQKKKFEGILLFYQQFPAMIISVSLASIGIFVLLFLDIFTSNIENDLREFMTMIFSLVITSSTFILFWAFYNYKITSMQNQYKDLIFYIAKLKSSIH